MKRLLTLLLGLCALAASANAQDATTIPADSLSNTTATPTSTVEVAPRYQLDDIYASSEQLEDVVAKGVAEGVATNPKQLNNRYKLYPTNNMWTFLKLDTCTGRVWQVQYTINEDNRMQNQFIYTMLDWSESWDELDNIGRFELYPTQNMYNFLLLDKKSGRIWQIQWSTNPENRGLIAEIE